MIIKSKLMPPLVDLAKLAVESYVKDGKIIEPPENLPSKFLEKASGVFITIEKHGELRACIGTYLPTRPNVIKEVIDNAVAAASKDYRFGPIEPAELTNLSYVVYVLSDPEPIKNNKELNPKKFGLIVKTNPLGKENKLSQDNVPDKTGLLLPDLPGISTPEEQISIACQKAGINPEKEKIFVYRFIAEKYHE